MRGEQESGDKDHFGLPIFRPASVFPNPTGGNGYEDLAVAYAVMQRGLRHVLNLNGPGPHVSLSQMRAALATPEVGEALAALRRGLRKPCTPPTPEGAKHVSVLLLIADMVSSLLVGEQYVLLAEGR